MDGRSRVEQFEAIRVGYRAGVSIRELAREHRVHRRTIRAAIASPAPSPRKTPQRDSPVTGPWEDVVRGWLTADLTAPRKQRHTARRVWQRLVDEHGAQVSESAIRGVVARLKVEVGLKKQEVMIVQEHLAGAEAEVDFGEAQAVIANRVERLWVFRLRLSYSGKAVHFPYTNQTSESFLDGHVRAFTALGGVPARIRYDNLKPAVLKVLLGRDRLEHPAFVTMRSHYGFESFYCIPGADGAHEKGGVEGEVGRFRRRHLTPVPHLGSLPALAQAFAAADARDDARHIEDRPVTVGAMFAAEQILGVLVQAAGMLGDHRCAVADREAGRSQLDGVAATTLGLPTVRAQAAAIAAAAARERLTHKAFLAEVLTAECDERAQRRRARRIKEARFPRNKRLEDFRADLLPDLSAATVADLASCAWIDQHRPLVLLGDSGTGKTHLLIALGTVAAEQGRAVRYTTTAALANELTEAADHKELTRVLARYARLDLLCLDEVGYVHLDPRGAELLFQIITAREERASIACASNAPFSEWGNTFTDPRLAAAVVDRLTFNGYIIQTGTTSYRLATTQT